MEKNKAIQKITDKIKKVSRNLDSPEIDKPVFHKGNKTGILIIHGLDNTAHIMSEYCNFFIEKRFTVYSITLPGRGVSLKKFAKTTWEDWINFAKEDYLLLKSTVKNIFIAGFSTGATIALYLVENLKNECMPNGVLLMSPAISFVNHFIPLGFQKNLLKIFEKINPFPKKIKNRDLIFKDLIAAEKYDRVKTGSTKSIIELIELAKMIRTGIKKIQLPIIIFQSKKDVVVHPYGAKWLFKKIMSTEKKLILLEKSGHPVMVDIEKDKVFEESYKFILSIIEKLKK